MLPTEETACDLALARAALYRLACLAFRHPDRDWEREWRSLAAGAREAARLCEGERSSAGGLQALVERACAASRSLGETVAEHARVFGHIPRAAATPYETEWTGAAGDLLQYHQISDIAAFYNAFGLQLGRSCDERPDHVGLELEFLHFLCVKEAFGLAEGLDDLAALCRETEGRFLAEHLARWAGGLCARMQAASGGGFYGAVADLLSAWIEDELRRLRVEPGEPILEPPPTAFRPEDACVGCGQASACLGELERHGDRRR